MLWSTDLASLRKQWWSSKALLNSISHSDELPVPSHYWLLYVLDGWCSAPAAICCLLSPVPAGTPLLSRAFYALCVMSEVISLDVGFIRGIRAETSPRRLKLSQRFSQTTVARGAGARVFLNWLIRKGIEKEFKYTTVHERPAQLL